ALHLVPGERCLVRADFQPASGARVIIGNDEPAGTKRIHIPLTPHGDMTYFEGQRYPSPACDAYSSQGGPSANPFGLAVSDRGCIICAIERRQPQRQVVSPGDAHASIFS